MLTRLTLQNVGPFAEADLSLGPITVIVGPNNSGKTTLLRALSCLSLESKGDFYHATGVSRRLSSSSEAVIRWSGASSERKDFSATVQAPGDPRWPDLTVETGGTTYGVDTQNQPSKGATPRGFRNNPWHLIGDWRRIEHPDPATQAELRAPGRHLREMRWFAPLPKQLRRPSGAEIDGGVWLNDHKGGFGLPSALANLAAADAELATCLIKKFRETFTEFSRYQVRPTKLSEPPDDEPKVAGYELSFPLAAGGELTVDQVSDGVLLYLALLLVLHLPDPPSVLLYEEPECGVHPSRLAEMVEILRQFAIDTGCQVVLTTHMPYVLDGVEPDEASFCYRDADGHARCASFADVDKLGAALSFKYLGELWAEYGEQNLAARLKPRSG